MIVYRSGERIGAVSAELRDLREIASRIPAGKDDALDLLIHAGEVEAGIADALCPERDSIEPAAAALREATLAAGRAFRSICEGDGAAAVPHYERVAASLASAAAFPLPSTARLGIPEGYAYYALYPECYLRAAARFCAEKGPRRCAVIGIRSIGTSLSAVVAAELEARGCQVRSWTVRPRGHPFDREARLDETLERAIVASGDWYAIVDEGPGLSGTSMTCVAARLSELGAPDDRIVLFPSWTPDGSAFVNAAARERWRRHAAYAVAFEEVWLTSDGRASYSDLSASKWRSLLFGEETKFPAAHPQHERRKYLDVSSGILRKFAGLSRFGRSRLERAVRLWRAEFAPRAIGLEDGFLLTEFVEGRPLNESDVSAALLERMARYLAWIAREFSSSGESSFDDLIEMVRVNAGEGLGSEWAERASALAELRAQAGGRPAVALDARMMPHEWLETAQGFLKTDGVDHHDDHFFPGCRDIAWDVAGACVELNLDRAARASLVEQYAALSGDRAIGERLPFHEAAYLAFRLGYASMACQTLARSPDARRFDTLRRRYAARLRRALLRATRPYR